MVKVAATWVAAEQIAKRLKRRASANPALWRRGVVVRGAGATVEQIGWGKGEEVVLRREENGNPT